MNRITFSSFFLLMSSLTAARELRSTALAAREPEEIHLSAKADRSEAFATQFRGEIWKDPALCFYYLPYSLTRVKGTGSWHDKGEACLRQTGDKDTRIGMDVRSFVVLNERSRVFGEASYQNEKQEAVAWNENLDWEWIAPYVTGDSIGGFMKGETYRLKGGYAYQTQSWTFGVTADYRAAHSFRDKDPRPQNTASDLSGTAAVSYRLNRYRLSLAGSIRWYQQNSDIAFLADKGSTPVYHLSGLGTDYTRFAGNQTSSKHKGVQWGGRLSMLPADTQNGISATLSFLRLSMEKQLSRANNLPLQNLGTTEVKGNVTWMKSLPSATQWGARLEAEHELRKGSEYIYGEAGGNEYGTLIGDWEGIQIRRTKFTLSGLWEQLATGQRTWGGAVVPSLHYHQLKAEVATASRFVESTAIQGWATARLYYRPGRLHLTAEVQGGYTANCSNRYSLGTGSSDSAEKRINDAAMKSAMKSAMNSAMDSTMNSATKTLLGNIRYLTDSYSAAGVRLQGSYPVARQTIVSLSLEWQGRYYQSCGKSQLAACSVGITF